VARFFSGLIRGVLLRARVSQHVAQTGRQGEGALLAVEDARELEARGLIGQADLLSFVELLGHGAVELHRKVRWHQQLLVDLEGVLVEVDVARVVGIPEVVDRRGDDSVEGIGPIGVAIDLDQGQEVVSVDRVVNRVVGDLVGHARVTPLFWALWGVSACEFRTGDRSPRAEFE